MSDNRACLWNLRFASKAILRIEKICFAWLNRLYFKLCGIEYGQNLNVYNRVYIQGRGTIRIGNNFTFSSGGCINPICRNIRGSLCLVSKSSTIEIGHNVGISSSCIWVQEKITIGNNVNIGGDCIIMDHDAHPLDFERRRYDYTRHLSMEDYIKQVTAIPIVIEDDVWIGCRCIILKGVRIGARSIVAAGSVVTKDIPSDSVAGGNPCKVIRCQTRDRRHSFSQ